MRFSFGNLFHRTLTAPRRAHLRPRLRLLLEELEGRVAPSATPQPLGPEFAVSAGGTNFQPAVAVNAAGTTMVVWAGSTPQNLSGQLFDAQRNPIGATFTIATVGVDVLGSYLAGPIVTADAAGNFMVAFDAVNAQPNGRGSVNIYLRSYESQGTPLTAPRFFTTANTAQFTEIDGLAPDGAGNLVASWHTDVRPADLQPTQHHGDLMHIDRFGNSLGPVIDFVDTVDTVGSSELVTALATAPDGTATVVWTPFNSGQVSGRIYDSAGNPKAGPFVIGAADTGNALALSAVRAAADATGHFDVFWPGNNSVQGRRYDAAGNPLGAAFQASTAGSTPPRLGGAAADAAGDFTVLWDDMAHSYDPQGRPIGDAYVFTSGATQAQVAYDPTHPGNFVVVASAGTPGNVQIYGQWFIPPPDVQPPAAQAVLDTGTLVFSAATGNAITVADPAAASSAQETVFVQDSFGPLHIANAAGLASISGNGSDLIALTGTIDQLNAALDGLTYSPPAFTYSFAETLSILLVHPNGASAAGGVDVNVTHVMDVHVPAGPFTVLDNGVLVFSQANGNPIGVADANGSSGTPETVFVQAAYATLHVANTSGLGSITGNGSNLVALTGTLGQLNEALDGLTFTPATFTYGYVETLSVMLLHPSHSTASAFVSIDVTHLNLAPTVTVPASPLVVDDDSRLVLARSNGTGISVADVDGGSGQETVLLQASAGTLTLYNTTGLAAVTGDGTALVSLTGTLDQLNNALGLNGLFYTPPALYHGPAFISVLAGDNGNTGDSGPMTGSAGFALTVTVGNIPPTVNGPHTQTAGAGILTFSAANGNAITVADADADGGIESIVVQALAGALSVANSGGLNGINGNGTHLLNLDGTIAAINSALDGMMYQAPADISSDYIGVLIDDLGNTGGRASTAALSIALSVDGSSDVAPVVSGPASQEFNLHGATFSQGNGNAIHVSDGDANGAGETVYLQVSGGTLTIAGSGAGVSGNGTSSVTLTGSVAAVNADLDGLHYAPAANPAFDFLDVTVTDGVRAGSLSLPMPFQDPLDNHLTLQGTLLAPAPQTIDAGAILVFSQANGNGFHVAAGDANGVIESLSLFVLHGRLLVGNTAGLTSIDGNGTSGIILYGTIPALNAALEGLQYAPDADASLDFLAASFGNNGSAGGAARFSVSFVANTVTRARPQA